MPFNLKAARKALKALGQDPIAVDPYEAQRRLLAGLNVGSPLIFDVGAHYGETIGKYRNAFPDCRIVAFEATPRSFEALRRRWGGDAAVEVVNKAVVSADGPVEFYVNAVDATSSTLTRPDAGRRYYPKEAATQTKVTVEGVSLDSFIADGEVPDVLKMDIQGGEIAALEGARAALRSEKLKMIYTEAMFVPHYERQPLLRDIWSHLTEFGFTLYNVFNLHVATNGQLRYGDALFVGDDVRRRCIDAMAEEP